jgi:hypothetical protein
MIEVPHQGRGVQEADGGDAERILGLESHRPSLLLRIASPAIPVLPAMKSQHASSIWSVSVGLDFR